MTHITAADLAKTYGLTARHWIRLAARGKVPGAYQPGGEGGKWLFDAVAFQRWFKSTDRKGATWPGSTEGEKSIGRAPNVKVTNTELPLKQQIEGWLRDALNSGSTSSKPSHGGNVLELPSRKP